MDKDTGFTVFDDVRPKKKARRLEDEDVEPGVPEDDMVFAAMAALERARAALHEADVGVDVEHYACAIRGGLSEAVKSGEAVHAAQGQAKSDQAIDFCVRRGLQKTFKATYSTWDQEPSRIMVRGWCHRMTHFLKVEMASPLGPAMEFADDIVAAYREPTELTQLIAEGSGKLFAKCRTIRDVPFKN